MKYIVSPSILSADKSRLIEEIQALENAGAPWVHYDIMDNIFVPNLSFSPEVVRDTKDHHHMFKDVHIMIIEPLLHAREYLDAGADLLTFHLEACKDENEALDTIRIIHSYNKKAGISIKPNTPVSEVIKYLDKVDLVLVMSVEPGFGGQKFMPIAVDKIIELRNYIDEHKLNCLIEVDGGINNETVDFVKKAGVDVIVAGSYVCGKADMKDRIAILERPL